MISVADEWQRLPAVWDTVRRTVDHDPTQNQFLPTGSASPGEHDTHSGVGRIIRLRMRPLSLAERGIGPTTVSAEALLTGVRPPLAGTTSVTLADYTN